MGSGRIIAKGFLQHQDFGLQQYTFITTPAFSNIGWNTCIGDDRDLLKEKKEVFRLFFPKTEPVYLSATHAEKRPSLYDWQRRIRWHFLTFKKRSLISTNCTILLILLLPSLAMKTKKKAEIQCILLFMEYYKPCPVLGAATTCLQKKGKPWSAACIRLPLETGGLKTPDIR